MRVIGIFDAFTSDAAHNAADAQKAGINAGYAQAGGELAQGRDALNTNYTAGLQPFLTNYKVASGGQNAYGDATGANGPEGYARALQNFQTNPGQQFQLQQGNENILRNASRTGSINSGGTNIDLLKFGQGVANQNWTQYVQNLLPFLGQSTQNASGIGNLYSGLGNQINNNYGQSADLAWKAMTGIGNADANAALDANRASTAGLNGIMQGVNLASGLAGFLPSGGGLSGLPNGGLPAGQSMASVKF